jgi:hypothetical protein
MPPPDYAKNSDWAHKRLVEALKVAAAERDMTLPATIELFTEDTPERAKYADSFWTAIGGYDPDLMLILATALVEPAA